MVTVTFDKRDLFDLLGSEVPDDLLTDILMDFGGDVDYLTRTTISVELLPNRPDLYSVEGLARALALFLGKRSTEEERKRYSTFDSKIELIVEEVPIRPCIVGAVIELPEPLGIELNLNLIALQEILHKSICRERKKGAIGLHDLDKVKSPFIYRTVPRDFRFTPLDSTEEMMVEEILRSTKQGMDYGHLLQEANGYPMIVDLNGDVLSFPPIINGNLTRLESSTRRMFIDVTGTDYVTIKNALEIICCSIIERGGRIGQVRMGKEKSPELSWNPVDFNEKFAKDLLGFSGNWEKLLSKMGLDLEGEVAWVPPYRADILHSVDVVEDAAIAYGYMKIHPKGSHEFTMGEELAISRVTGDVRGVMVGMGFQEIISLSLTSAHIERRAHLSAEGLEISNPLSENYSMLRSSLIPGLLVSLRDNEKRAKPLRLFEVGDVIIGGKNRRRICGMVEHEGASLTEIKSCAKKLMDELGLSLVTAPQQHGTFITGRCGFIYAEGKTVGVMGEVSPEILENFSLEMPVVCFAIDIEGL